MYQSPNAPTTVNVEDPIAVMQRFELKYILNREQMAYLQRRLEGHMQPDQFGRTSIASLYYDTPDMRLIRTSLEGLPFKEKLRLRSYGLATETSPVFLELKRKAHGVVYKRRVQTTVPRAEGFFRRENQPGAGGQIDRELTYFRDHYENLAPSCLIIYDRTAYFTPGGDLRLTIDENPPLPHGAAGADPLHGGRQPAAGTGRRAGDQGPGRHAPVAGGGPVGGPDL